MSAEREPKLWECIYCRVKLGELQNGVALSKKDFSDEHIVGKGIGGSLTILRASCPDCRRVTSADEAKCFRGALDIMRALEGLRRSKGRPARTSVPVLSVHGTSLKGQLVPVGDTPTVGKLPAFGPPNVLCGKAPDDRSGVEPMPLIPLRMPSAEALRLRLGADELLVLHQLDIPAFARMLAKIGHAYAVKKRGLGGFEPFLPKVIHGDVLNWWNWVGCSPYRGATEPTHKLWLYEDDVFGDRLLVVQIGLFSKYRQAPHYLVVAGRTTAQGSEI